jgi:hypothetical protein
VDPGLRQHGQEEVHYLDAIHSMSFAAKMRRTLSCRLRAGDWMGTT